MIGRLTPITARDIDGLPSALKCGHALPRSCYDAAREEDGLYSCPACAREWQADVLQGRFGEALRALMPAKQGALL